MYHNNQKYIENGASVAGNHSVRGLGPLKRGIATAPYLVGCVTPVPDLSRWVPSGFPEVTREFSRCVVLLLNQQIVDNNTKRDNFGVKRGISVWQRV